MISSSKKCKGCGASLTTNPDSIGYTPNLDFDYCQRCFQLINYNKNSNDVIYQKQSQENLDKIEIKNNYLFMVVDILNIPGTLIDKFKDNKMTLIVNKYDLLTTNKQQKMIDNIKQILKTRSFLNVDNIILSSSIKNDGIRKISDLIKKSDFKKKIYFIGKTNVGKSSLINSLIDFNNAKQNKLTTSPCKNTTLNYKKVVINKKQIIDCPGFSFDDQIFTNKKLLKIIKPITFQIRKNSNFAIGNLFKVSIECLNNITGSITFYSQINEKIQRQKFTEFLKENEKKIIKFNCQEKEKYNLNISGYGLITLKNIKSITILIDKKININFSNIGVI